MSTPADNANSNEVYVGRQPIFDQSLNVYGYELLFRSGHTTTANVIDGNHATSQVIINTFLEIGLEHISNHRYTFINLTRDFLLGDIPLPLQSEKIVLEVLEDVEVDDKLIAAIKQLSAQGFTIALDDFVLNEKNRALLPLADIIKIDLMVLDTETLKRHVTIFKKLDVQLLAEKIETEEEYEMCKELGFDYYQGYYFCKPHVVSGKQLPANRLALLEMIAKLQSPDCDMHELEQIISRDVAISYKLLRIINSSYYSMQSTVDSIKKALLILGLKPLKSWVTVIGLSMVDDKPPELITISLTRAKMCERLAPALGINEDAAFTVGLFSMLDVLLDKSLADLVTQLPLDDEVIKALLAREGKLGELLNLVTQYEEGQWQEIDQYTIDKALIRQGYLDALEWSGSIIAEIAH
ncbi:EAL and HDOD domain-containing protein [Sulfuriflexus mobilis]|uniref:EAL and HDOD domain-containing protein n=1 Tax=Sulfuriflexus mobilis TaxID=1811807 RepID=UPI000F84C85E|nr:HDOD domain-containing protein [Sulfuriflexus mobilis]